MAPWDVRFGDNVDINLICTPVGVHHTEDGQAHLVPKLRKRRYSAICH
jgi:hypothetical protein